MTVKDVKSPFVFVVLTIADVKNLKVGFQGEIS